MGDSQTILIDSAELREADAQAVMDHFLSGSPLEPVVAHRVRARSERVTSDVYRRFGELNVAVDLIRKLRDGE